jgi:hypothetical protein
MNDKCSTKITVEFSLAITELFKVPQYFFVIFQYKGDRSNRKTRKKT